MFHRIFSRILTLLVCISFVAACLILHGSMAPSDPADQTQGAAQKEDIFSKYVFMETPGDDDTVNAPGYKAVYSFSSPDGKGCGTVSAPPAEVVFTRSYYDRELRTNIYLKGCCTVHFDGSSYRKNAKGLYRVTIKERYTDYTASKGYYHPRNAKGGFDVDHPVFFELEQWQKDTLLSQARGWYGESAERVLNLRLKKIDGKTVLGGNEANLVAQPREEGGF